MAEAHHESSGSSADFDLSQFYQIFFEEAGENLDLMEQMLLSLNLEKTASKIKDFDDDALCLLEMACQ